MALEQLAVYRVRFELETLAAVEVPAYKGDMLRRALLWWLSEAWCQHGRCRRGCQAPETCLFGRLCQPALNRTWPMAMQRLVGDTPPPAYTIWDDHDRRRRFATGSAWSFELGLVGDLAARQLPTIMAAVEEAGQRGIGREQVRGRVQRVVARRETWRGPTVDTTLAEVEAGGARRLMLADFRLADIGVTTADAARAAEDGPIRGVSLRFLSPTIIKKLKEVMIAPDFSAVVRAVVRRLRLLSLMYGAGEWVDADFGPLLDVAETVRLEHDETQWLGYVRQSERAGVHPVEGFIGEAWYAGDDLRPVLPALWLGQWLHIGKFYVIGHGRYSIGSVYR